MMSLENYGVLKGAVVDTRFASGKNPHYQAKVVDDRDIWRIAINVQSADQSLVEYIIENPGTVYSFVAAQVLGIF